MLLAYVFVPSSDGRALDPTGGDDPDTVYAGFENWYISTIDEGVPGQIADIEFLRIWSAAWSDPGTQDEIDALQANLNLRISEGFRWKLRSMSSPTDWHAAGSNYGNVPVYPQQLSAAALPDDKLQAGLFLEVLPAQNERLRIVQLCWVLAEPTGTVPPYFVLSDDDEQFLMGHGGITVGALPPPPEGDTAYYWAVNLEADTPKAMDRPQQSDQQNEELGCPWGSIGGVRYAYTFLTTTGNNGKLTTVESPISPWSPAQAISQNSKRGMDLSGIETGPNGVTGRRVYRLVDNSNGAICNDAVVPLGLEDDNTSTAATDITTVQPCSC